MYDQSATDVLVASAFSGGMAGLLIGLVPLLLGYIRRRTRDGATGLLLCVVLGAIGGVVAAGIIALVVVIFIASVPSAPKRIPCPHCRELIMPGATVCRFCGRDLEVAEKAN